ncbi:glycerol-3-phosphate 1-O-acyltransferase PlsY [Parvularcula sp. ZS-1/3]|uniref:Glycerol-3-phosphate acyltransferase n=1 Tax=Parvularcula mediterranea TaxID=2732508 RepID=A0A7Y3RM78_9PROT|nr:glycerol-3-phosphate 1-O-acyltransferase PlsY [Parvularcula mediterranea]NNU16682.1 glycerol-3-phosphate 1-O-acyltransferase PlsY [Parvularcula mediterranea]
MTILLVAIGAYLLGSIPFGLFLTRMAGLGDIREIGSGNIGATNVLRTGRKDLALATLLGDSGKGAVAVVIARLIGENDPVFAAVAGAAAFLGHCFPIYLKFKGGKGVATYIGTILAMWPLGLVAAGVIWLAMAAIFRFSSLAALVMAAAMPFVFLGSGRFVLFAGVFAMSLMIFYRHKANIMRLMDGTEPKIGKK